MRTLSLALRWVHVLAAVTWLGGMLFLALVLVPATRRLENPGVRAQLMHLTGVRFRTVGWIALALLVATGIGNLLVYPAFLSKGSLHLKLALVLLALGLSVVHDFVLGPRAGAPGADPAIRTWSTRVARINVLAVLVIVALGIALRG